MTQAQASKLAAMSDLPPANAAPGAKKGRSAGPKKGAGGRKAAPRRRKTAKIGPPAGWGDKIAADLAREGDPVEVTMLIRQAARCADRLEGLDRVLRGDASNWLRLEAAALVDREGKVPARVTVELKVDDAVREERAQSKLFATLIADIHRRRAAMPPAPANGTGKRRGVFDGLDDDDNDDD